ncbi:hypothetical protein HMPREF9569_01998 [Cutibacterium acnes HL078PA1]|nr:hypothetical protein HMPREF9569_01998 [Cutibacterium acnes HL078PA1]
MTSWWLEASSMAILVIVMMFAFVRPTWPARSHHCSDRYA